MPVHGRLDTLCHRLYSFYIWIINFHTTDSYIPLHLSIKVCNMAKMPKISQLKYLSIETNNLVQLDLHRQLATIVQFHVVINFESLKLTHYLVFTW